jgi:hypothetical protein
MAENWRDKFKMALKEIVLWATTLKGFLIMFSGVSRGLSPQVQTIADTVIDALKHLKKVADFISSEISKNEEEINWETISSVFPTQDWLSSIEKVLSYFDNDQQFRQFMSGYGSTLREDFVNHITTKFQDIARIFRDELGRREESFENYEDNLPSIFSRISQILMEEFGEYRGFSDYWNSIVQQFNDAWKTADENKLWDVYSQVRELFEIMPEEKKKAYESDFEKFFETIKDTFHLRKFRLIRCLLGK